MGPVDDRFEFDPSLPVVLASPEGGTAVEIRRLDFGPDVEAFGQMSVDTIASAAGTTRLGLDWVGSLPDWDTGNQVDVVLVMAESARAAYASSDAVVAALTGGDAAPACDEASWKLVEATQSIAMPGDPSASIDVGIQAPD